MRHTFFLIGIFIISRAFSQQISYEVYAIEFAKLKGKVCASEIAMGGKRKGRRYFLVE